MAQARHKIKPEGSINVDVSEKYVLPTEKRYALNCERGVNSNTRPGISSTKGHNNGKTTVVLGNTPLVYPGGFWPAGTNTELEAYESKKTNEIYIFIHNSNNDHFIYRINGDDNTIQKVNQGAHLGFSLDPKYSMRNRVRMYFNHNSFREAVNKIYRKYLIWTTGAVWQNFLDVETSIATNSFTTGYFTPASGFDPAEYTQLPTRQPMRCASGSWIALAEDDWGKINKMKDKTWQFRTKFIYTDGRESDWSPISTAFYLQKSPCQAEAEGLPRCIKLVLPAGSPLVEKIVVAFRNCNGDAFNETNPTDWFRYDIVDKYNKCLNQDISFYTRTIRTDIGYDAVNNTFEYTFCGDKECTPIDVKDTNRNFNPMPIYSFALTDIEDRLDLINNVIGYDGVACDAIEKLHLTITEPEVSECKIEYVKVKIAVLIHNIFRQVTEPIFSFDGDAENDEKHFGGLMYRHTTTPFDSPVPYLQNFYGKRKGFIAYVEGSSFYSVTEQNWCDNPGSGVFSAIGPETNFNDQSHRRGISKDMRDRKFWVNFAEIKVPKGTKGFIRLAGHEANDETDFQNTSTQVYGIYQNGVNGYDGRTDINEGNTNVYQKEIYFDACGGDVDLTDKPFVVADLTYPSGDVTTRIAATAFKGYVKDKALVLGGVGKPVERLRIDQYNGGERYSSYITDHNGFYFATWGMDDGFTSFYWIGADFIGEGPGCTEAVLKHQDMEKGTMPNTCREIDIVGDTIVDYNIKYYSSVQVTVKDCEGVPIPGIAVAIAGSKAKFTNSLGVATIIVRNRMWAYGIAYTERAVIVQNGLCYLMSCEGGCDSCMPDDDVDFAACFADVDGNPPQIDAGESTFDNFFGLSRGLKNGGRYAFGFKLHDATGRHTFIQTSDSLYLDIPSVNKKNRFGFSIINWAITGLMNLPSWAKYISFWRTANLAFAESLQWVVDGIDWLDAAGNPSNSLSADKIRISIQSNNDYNTFFDTTTTKYAFLNGDKIQFIADNEGKIYDTATNGGLLEFKIEGFKQNEDIVTPQGTPTDPYSQLVISYDKRLKDLKVGALIQLIRPNDCATEQLFFEMCPMIKIAPTVPDPESEDPPPITNEPVITSGIFSTFDTYQLRRAIRYDKKKNTFPFSFEHHSPSDFWGSHCDDRGRINVKNIYEKQIQLGRSNYVSDVWLENGNLNGLSKFRENNVKNFEGEVKGDIIVAITNEKKLMMGCEFDNFIAQISDDFARIGADGILRTSPLDNVLSDPYSKLFGNYGIQYDDVGSFVFGDGWAFWIDEYNKAPVLHNWGNAKNVAYDEQGRSLMVSYFQSKLEFKFGYNKNVTAANKIKVNCGYDEPSGNVMITFRKPGEYIANRPEIDTTKNETLAFCVRDKTFPTFYSFTPEGYGVLKNTLSGHVFFSFKNGVAYLHRGNTAAKFNTFYGTPCDQWIEVLLNRDTDSLKNFIAIEGQSTAKYFVDRVLTDKDGVISEIPPIRVKFTGRKFNAAFLCNKNTLGPLNGDALYRGEELSGYYAKVRFCRDNSLNNNVVLKDDAKRQAYSELDSILMTYSYREQSGLKIGNGK